MSTHCRGAEHAEDFSFNFPLKNRKAKTAPMQLINQSHRRDGVKVAAFAVISAKNRIGCRPLSGKR
jgi:hypothetical protein